MTESSSSSAYGKAWLPVTRANWQDRLAGQHARANARMGYVKQPPGEGSKLLWIKAGATEESVKLGAELLAAIREKRLDLKIVLTFETDYPDLLARYLNGLKNIGLGYGPSDRPAVVKRMLSRWQPFGLIVLDERHNENLIQQAETQVPHVLAYGSGPVRGSVEAAYPFTETQHGEWQQFGSVEHLAPPVHPRWQFVEAQADITLKTLVRGNEERLLFWWHQDNDVQALLDAWQSHPLSSQGVLFVSGQQHAQLPRLSQWDRQPMPAGHVVWVDDAQWYAALASASDGIHVNELDETALCHAASGGTPMSLGERAVAFDAELQRVLPQLDDSTAVFACWQDWAAQPMESRRLGDAVRRVFWDRRRQLQSVFGELLQRVFDW